MKIIDFYTIKDIDILCSDCVEWVRDALFMKKESILPPKISIKLEDNIFHNTMPCYIPSLKKIGVKMVSRYPRRIPALLSEILLYDSDSGELLALINGDWITAMRTGAVAALAIKTLQSRTNGIYSFVGLGNTARATLLCLLNIQPDVHHKVRVLSYKNQEDSFINRFKGYTNISFDVVKTNKELVSDADVIISCVTAFDDTFAPEKLYKKGVLIIPVHTRGFQNCDMVFDKVIGDDYDHIKEFKYFSQFKKFIEFADILKGNVTGRNDTDERILSYNIGIALHDIYFASRIYSLYENTNKLNQIILNPPMEKFWI